MTTPEAATAAAAPATGTTATVPGVPDGRGVWQAYHVFYAASPRPFLLRCVRPLVAELTGEGLLSGWFFINYWLEGPHIRLRLRPSSPAAASEVASRTSDAIAAFLKERPALYEVKGGFLADLYNTLFELEFPGGERGGLVDEDGHMKLRPNNTFSSEPYEPEYGKYGGPAGIELAEWHFQRSSELVSGALGTMNLHLRTVLLGVAAQLMMTMSGCLLRDDTALLGFLDRYHEFWNSAFATTNYTAQDGYDRAYGTMEALPARFQQIRAAVAEPAPERLPSFLGGWAEHCLDLRERVVALARGGDLVFRSWDGERDLPVTDQDQALPMLLSPYMHMTNNRLSVTVRDEAFLSYVLARALREPRPTAAP
ncbi:lantibiotic dehydratase C-terminal domain-containing protein [Actinacidiphila bryophytorum]|uniref:Thiopeptide-type bacteriocin biosynthesis domain-containing protein n=1 Tax=Actinacidiphila bryophytorum TaxID=1436133 RepID=A0A9W4H651_9ACTN|nr:lantibiotic dehydratase C-terminal domain-containing protein [Actinacidiphila bryophytorum]MBM9438594.1 lantibiotic biosynthesis protein [Actinacidiphila bryophytorum]MBN6544100.1 lantibiotic biosynthesis protein [Actinacidiphila bryophytorum]CAG7653682.1 Thiopeptide-type bacteriocin biosynthesis domain-containing protein [Actinacidiphila bryophytorum]